jgi:molybdopterin molybdotransferase
MSNEPALSVSEALRAVLERTNPLGAESITLDDSLGRVLAETVASDVDMPPFDRSAMDGFALRSADVKAVPATLRVVGQVRAGESKALAVGPGEAVQIMTGAPVPQGADAVQQVERTSCDAPGLVAIRGPVDAGANIAPRGSEVRVGDVVLPSGRFIDPATIAVLAAVGCSQVSVGRRPTLAVLVTGDEIVPVHQKPTEARIRNSNGPALRAQALWAGARAVSLGVAGDDETSLARAMEPGLDADILVVSGGVSAGAYDLVEGVFERVLGVEIVFRRVAIKPGAPLVFGHRGKTLIFGLPGNPVSAQVTFDIFVKAALLKMQGASHLARPTFEVVLQDDVRNRSGRAAHIPARVRFERGRWVARTLRSMGSADIVAHAGANALVVLAADRTSAASGETAPALLMGNFLERGDGE